ncbi:hypothetical protein dqs_2994 [Azoarcus olearius]|uniref:HvfC family RiPP maturation protein n=1 Tax=Azoarcus sp. (strain BH72) TaxID=418699 RepID=UPI0008060C1E|nr:putative DNA-binding domain-containing protein [Azoarcus olearius]ANQ86022.1 hypothetical protein dqs_2994 [Azoarcus olearius]
MNAPAALRQFQHDFGRRLRDPGHAPLPAGLDRRRTAAYETLLFDKLCGVIDRCFPVARATLGEARWRRLCRAFVRDWRCSTPWFRAIPREFVDFLDSGCHLPLPAWLPDLARYEWAELAVELMAVSIPGHAPDGDLYAGRPLANPACMLVASPWPVQRIGPAYRPRRPQPAHLAIFRDLDDAVRFAELRPATARLLALLQQQAAPSGEAALVALAAELGYAANAAYLAHGRASLDELRSLGLILGVRT